ncbi:MAG: lysylphosphatidylglycerol synthase transmembrane domain-containing protein [Candidatus Omnitrophica bacterium]|nr:lysylphosphatidylglycerol synthase transmembrane domain-containing protein [Candidatus Omnitrophota bacterium]
MVTFKKILSVSLRIIISIILLVLLFKFNKINLLDLINDIKGADKTLLAAGFIIFFSVYLLGFWRWHMLLKAAGIQATLKRLLVSFSGGVFFSIFLPSTIGGDIVKTADLAGHTRKTKEVIATVLLDRLSGYIGLVLVILPVLLLDRGLARDKVVISSVIVIVVLLIFILLVLFNRFIYSKITRFLTAPGAGKIREAISDLHSEIHIFRRHKKLIIYNLILSFFIQMVMPVSVYFIALSLGIKIKLLYFLIFLPIIGAITLLPIAIGGLGLRENLFVVYFAKAGVVKQLAVAMSLLSFSFVVIYGAVGGLIYVLTVHHRRVQHHQPPQIHQANP